jgi:3-oxoacyl-[acyl-carrier-protein] synthase II
MPRSVVITGVGVVSPFGAGVTAFWQGLVEGRSAVVPITRFDASGFGCRLGGEASGFSAKDSVPKHYRKAVKVMARDIELAVGAAKEACEDARLVTRGTLPEDSADSTTYPGSRMGCHIGAGLISAESDELTAAFTTARGGDGSVDLAAWGSRGMENLTPLWMLKYLPNMLACHVTIIHGCEGPSNTITCAEASGLLSVAESARVIERGAADLCFSGSAENKLSLMGMVRTQYAARLGTKGTGEATSGAQCIKAFDPAGDCGAPAEGGAILILEEAAGAAKRNVPVYARVSGTGAGHSARRPYEGDGKPDLGLQAAIENALDDAGLRGADIDAIVLMGTGVAGIDLAEAGAVKAVFGDKAQTLPVVTLGAAIGNTMAGNASLLAAAGALCVKHQRLPARINAGKPVLPGATGMGGAMKLRHVLVAASSLGGQNAAAVLSDPTLQ